MKHFDFRKIFLLFFCFQANLFASDFTEEEIRQINPKIYEQLERAESEEKFLHILNKHSALKEPNISHPPVIIAFIKNYFLRLAKGQPEKTLFINIAKIVEAGVPIDQKGPDGNTALHRIVVGEKLFKMDARESDSFYLRYHQHIVLELLASNPNLTLRNKNGHTVLELALVKDPLCNQIILALTNRMEIASRSTEGFQAIANEPMFIDQKWRTPLVIVIKYVSSSVVNEILSNLIKMGAEIKNVDALYYLDRLKRKMDLDETHCSEEMVKEAKKLLAQWEERVALKKLVTKKRKTKD